MTGTVELLPGKGVYRPDEPVTIELRGMSAQQAYPNPVLTVRSLGDVRSMHTVPAGGGFVDLGPLPVGGYGVELSCGGAVAARTAVQVDADPRSVLRYGFAVDFRPDRADLAEFSDNLRRLHLTGVQFYDWAYRHADLNGGGEQYADALGQPVSLATVRALIDVCHSVGADALGYAAVYAAGPQEWPQWEHDALLTATGAPYGLGDFLFLVDPAAEDWLGHFSAELSHAAALHGFDGFHLDQYGYPKRAHRPDGALVDVAESFSTLIRGVRAALPSARLVFNNVNDFPTWSSPHAPQDAVYIEPWAPSTGLEHLARMVTRAHSEAHGKPIAIAAYQHVYDSAPAEQSDRSTSLTMATLLSHGATQLLCGEADRILVDPYYVRNHTVEPSTADLLRRWYDFAVEHAQLLTSPDIRDVTGSYAGTYNDDIDVVYARTGTPVADPPAPGTVWRRVTQIPGGGDHGDQLVVHLINLAGQDDTLWDAPRGEPADPGPATLRIRRAGPALPRVRVADPDRGGRLTDVEVTADGDHAHARLPAPHLWQLVLIDPAGAPDAAGRTTAPPRRPTESD